MRNVGNVRDGRNVGNARDGRNVRNVKKNRMNGSQGKVQREWNSITADFNIYHSTPRCRGINPFCINIVPLQHFLLNQ